MTFERQDRLIYLNKRSDAHLNNNNKNSYFVISNLLVSLTEVERIAHRVKDREPRLQNSYSMSGQTEPLAASQIKCDNDASCIPATSEENNNTRQESCNKGTAFEGVAMIADSGSYNEIQMES